MKKYAKRLKEYDKVEFDEKKVLAAAKRLKAARKVPTNIGARQRLTRMAKAKTSGKRGFSFESMPELKLKAGDAEAFKEILSAHLEVVHKERFASRAKIPKRTLFRMLSPEGNPTLENVARIVHALTKAA
jgi:hypothetical protein